MIRGNLPTPVAVVALLVVVRVTAGCDPGAPRYKPPEPVPYLDHDGQPIEMYFGDTLVRRFAFHDFEGRPSPKVVITNNFVGRPSWWKVTDETDNTVEVSFTPELPGIQTAVLFFESQGDGERTSNGRGAQPIIVCATSPHPMWAPVTSVTLVPGEARPVPVVGANDAPVTFSTSDAGVATVSAEGLVTAVAVGDATVTAVAAGETKLVTVEVVAGTVAAPPEGMLDMELPIARHVPFQGTNFARYTRMQVDSRGWPRFWMRERGAPGVDQVASPTRAMVVRWTGSGWGVDVFTHDGCTVRAEVAAFALGPDDHEYLLAWSADPAGMDPHTNLAPYLIDKPAGAPPGPASWRVRKLPRLGYIELGSHGDGIPGQSKLLDQVGDIVVDGDVTWVAYPIWDNRILQAVRLARVTDTGITAEDVHRERWFGEEHLWHQDIDGFRRIALAPPSPPGTKPRLFARDHLYVEQAGAWTATDSFDEIFAALPGLALMTAPDSPAQCRLHTSLGLAPCEAAPGVPVSLFVPFSLRDDRTGDVLASADLAMFWHVRAEATPPYAYRDNAIFTSLRTYGGDPATDPNHAEQFQRTRPYAAALSNGRLYLALDHDARSLFLSWSVARTPTRATSDLEGRRLTPPYGPGDGIFDLPAEQAATRDAPFTWTDEVPVVMPDGSRYLTVTVHRATDIDVVQGSPYFLRAPGPDAPFATLSGSQQGAPDNVTKGIRSFAIGGALHHVVARSQEAAIERIDPVTLAPTTIVRFPFPVDGQRHMISDFVRLDSGAVFLGGDFGLWYASHVGTDAVPVMLAPRTPGVTSESIWFQANATSVTALFSDEELGARLGEGRRHAVRRLARFDASGTLLASSSDAALFAALGLDARGGVRLASGTDIFLRVRTSAGLATYSTVSSNNLLVARVENPEFTEPVGDGRMVVLADGRVAFVYQGRVRVGEARVFERMVTGAGAAWSARRMLLPSGGRGQAVTAWQARPDGGYDVVIADNGAMHGGRLFDDGQPHWGEPNLDARLLRVPAPP